MKNTKIVSTIGPSTDSSETIEKLINSGVNVIRQNFSHVNHEQHGKIFDRIRDVSNKIGVMMDTKGPEIRLGKVEDNTVLSEGDTINLTTQETVGDEVELPVKYDDFIDNIEQESEVRIDDGKIELEVMNVSDSEARCEVVFGGEVSTRKAVNVPGEDIGLRAPTEKDEKDIRFAAKKGYDFISVSFVKHAEDVEKVREILEEENSNAKIISKIEHRKAVENFDEILDKSDGIMVARGDLGVEIPPAELPGLQKEMIRKCNRAAKPVITATQMLESMTENSTATRAEISDVANAVLDGTDAVMLSGETAIGEYPVKTVKFMSDIIVEAEKSVEDKVHHTVKERAHNKTEIVCKGAWQASRDGDFDLIVTQTSSGTTARKISSHRPETDLIAFTDQEHVERQLQLVWGVQPFHQEFHEHTDKTLRETAERLITHQKARKEDEIILTAGLPTPAEGNTNTMQIRTIKDILET